LSISYAFGLRMIPNLKSYAFGLKMIPNLKVIGLASEPKDVGSCISSNSHVLGLNA
jgi:hypothetical protein